MTIERLLYCGLSTFVLLLMFKDLDGPFDIFLRLRFFMCSYDIKGQPENFFAKLFACPWCLSTWISAVVSIITVVLFQLWWPVFFFLWLGSIAIAGLLYVRL